MSNTDQARQSKLSMPGFRTERKEDEFISSYREMLAVMQRVHDLGGDPHVSAIIDRARAALGRVPH